MNPPPSFSDLVKGLETKIGEIQSLFVLRSGTTDLQTDVLSDLSDRLYSVENCVSTLRSQVDTDMQLLAEAKSMRAMMERQAETVRALAMTRMAQESKGAEGNENAQTQPQPQPQPQPQQQQQQQQKRKSVQNGPTPAPAAAPPSTTNSSPSSTGPIKHINNEELLSVSAYARGRATTEKVNAAVDELNEILNEKAKILSIPPHKMGAAMLKRYTDMKELMTPEMNNEGFFTEAEVAKGTAIKLDATGKAILQVLRSVGRIREVRGGGVTRYVAC